MSSAGVGAFVTLWLLPPLFIAGLLWRNAVDVPWMDDFVTGETYHWARDYGGFSWGMLVGQHNESRPAFPRLLFQVLDSLSHWDLRYQMMASFVVILCTGLLMIRICRRTIDRPALAFAVALMVNFMLFSPVQWQNFLWGIQLIVFVPLLSLVIIMLSLGSRLGLWIALAISAIAAVVSTYSNSNGMLVWLLAIPFIIVHPSKFRWRGLGVWAVLMLIFVGYYFRGYVRPSYHPPMSVPLHQPALALKFLLAFLGNGVRQTKDFDLDVALGLSATSVLAVGLFCTAIIGRNIDLWRKALPWIMFGAYSIGSAAATTLGRFGFGTKFAITERYTTFAIPLWFSIVPLLIVNLQHLIPKKTLPATIAMFLSAAGGAVVVLLMVRGCLYIREELFLSTANRLAGRAAAQFAIVAPDNDAILATLYTDTENPKRIIRYMDREDIFHPQCFRTNDISTITDKENDMPAGSFDFMQQEGDHVLLVGWAYIPNHMTLADAVLLTTPDTAGVERVFAVVDDDRGTRDDVAKALKSQTLDRSGWYKRIANDRMPHGTVISAWAFDTYSRRAYRLAGSHPIP